MPDGMAPRTHVLLRGSRLQQARLAAGLVLLAFVSTHLLNHAAGLLGLGAMEVGQTLRFGFTRTWLGSFVLLAAMLVHIGLGLARIAQRRTVRMPVWEAVQIASGLLIPLLLIEHVVETRGASLLGASDFYRPVLAMLWPEHATRQLVLLMIVWAHAMIGVHHWLRLASWYGEWRPWLLSAAILLPVLALAGFLSAGREVAVGLAAPGARQALEAAHRWPDASGLLWLGRASLVLLSIYLAAVAVAIGLALQGILAEERLPKLSVTYAAGPTVEGPIGATLLEISRMRRVPHASVCGGRARCSTCRVRVDGSEGILPPAEFAEAVTLGSISAPDNVRLACQLRPPASLTVTRLVAPASGVERVPGALLGDAEGAERRLVVMFLDLKGFTALSEKRLPYDVVFLLNRFFRTIGSTIVAEGGWIDKYMGDGLLAVFGRETGLEAGARSALAAAARIDVALDRLNEELEAEGAGAVGVGMGIHAGQMVVGRVGYAEAAQITVIGATVNLASRLESLTRQKGCQLIISRAVADAASMGPMPFTSERVAVRGTQEPVEILLVPRARLLAGRALAS